MNSKKMMKNHKDPLHPSQVLVPKSEIEVFAWTLNFPRGKLKESIQSFANSEVHFKNLHFNVGFLNSTKHRWDVVLQPNLLTASMVLPKHQYVVHRSKIQLVALKKIKSEELFNLHKLVDGNADIANAPVTLWRGHWFNMESSIDNSIEAIRVVLEIERVIGN